MNAEPTDSCAITSLSSDPGQTPVGMLLRSRLTAVPHYLRLAALHADDDTEHVHQLRIATREALAAVDGFREWLPKRESAWLTKRLKQIRDAAGDARDFDVMLAEYQTSKISGRKDLVRALWSARRKSQRPLCKIYRRMNRRNRFLNRVSTCLATKVELTDEAMTSMAMQRLNDSASDLFRSKPSSDPSDRALHRFRIKAKHLRYSLELFACRLPREAIRDLYPIIKMIQKILGEFNDHVVAAKRFKALIAKAESKRFKRQLKRLRRVELKKAMESRRRYLEWQASDPLENLETVFE